MTARESIERRTFGADVLHTSASKVLILVLQLGSSVLMARALGSAGRGVTAVSFGLMALLAQVGTLGLPSANPYFVAKEPKSRAAVVWNSLWAALLLGTALVGVGALLKALVPSAVAGVSWEQLLIALAAIPAVLGGMSFHSVLLGEGRIAAYNFAELGLSAFTLLALAIGFGLFGIGLVGALGTLVGVRMVSAVAYLLLVMDGGWSVRAPDWQLLHRMLGYSLRLYAATLMAFMVIRIDMLLVNAYRGASQAGLYAVAVSFVDAIYVIPTAVSVNLFARVALGSGGDRSARVFRVVFVLYGGLCLASLLFCALAIRLLFGAAFGDAVTLYWLLVPGLFSLGMLNILAQHFAARGFPPEAVLVWLIGLAVNVALDVVLLPSHGTYVASLASSAAYTLLLALHMRMFAKETGGYRTLCPRLGEVRMLLGDLLGPTPISRLLRRG